MAWLAMDCCYAKTKYNNTGAETTQPRQYGPSQALTPPMGNGWSCVGQRRSTSVIYGLHEIPFPGKFRYPKNPVARRMKTRMQTVNERASKTPSTHQVGPVELRVRSDKVLAVDHAHHALHASGVHDGLGEEEGDGGQLVCGAGMLDCADEVLVVCAQSGTHSDCRKGRNRQVADPQQDYAPV